MLATFISVLLSVDVYAEDDDEQIYDFGDFQYQIIDEDAKEIEIYLYNGNDKVVNVPEQIDGYKVTSISYSSFKKDAFITEVILPDTIKKIEYDAFYDCSGLKKINFPSSLRIIDQQAFSGCESLLEVDLLQCKEFKSIAYRAFYNCSGLKKINFPSSLGCIEIEAFSWCKSLREINLLQCKKFHTIGYRAFYGCSSLEYVGMVLSYGDDNKKITGDEVFRKCYNIKQFDGYMYDEYYMWFENEVQMRCIDYVEGDYLIYRFSLSDKTYIKKYLGNESDVVIPDDIAKADLIRIYPQAFSNHDEIKSITLPDSVEYIDKEAFSGCSSLEEIKLSDNLKYIGEKSFYGCEKLKRLIIPKTVTNIKYSNGEPFDGRYLEKVVISSNIYNPKQFYGDYKGDIIFYEDYEGFDFNNAVIASDVTNIYASSSNFNNVTIEWDKANTSNGYYIYRSDEQDGEYKLIKTINDGNITKYIDEDINNESTYYYKVKAFMSDNKWCDGDLSDVIFINKLSIPKNKTVSYDETRAIINWGKIDRADGYYIYRATSKDGKYKKVAKINGNDNTSFIQRKSDQIYYYKIQAFEKENESGSSNYSDVIVVNFN